VKAKTYVPHPCYTPKADEDHDDIALIELATPVTITNLGGPFALVNGLNGSVDLPTGSSVTLAGFGTTKPDGTEASASLLEVGVKTVSKENCVKQNPKSNENKWINFDHVVCTGGEAGKDSCSGDSGGPAMLQQGKDQWVVGVLSKGSQLPDANGNCAVADRYGMYTLTSIYAGWIEAVISGQAFECANGYDVSAGSCSCTGMARNPVRTPWVGDIGSKGDAFDLSGGGSSDNQTVTIIGVCAGVGGAVLLCVGYIVYKSFTDR
jgi:secreted trypsin-like serine protease